MSSASYLSDDHNCPNNPNPTLELESLRSTGRSPVSLNRAALRCHFPSFGIQILSLGFSPPPVHASRFAAVFDGCAISQFQVQHRPKELPFLIINENCISSLLTRARDGIRPVDFLHHRWLVWVSILAFTENVIYKIGV